jgi:hypothetical protein
MNFDRRPRGGILVLHNHEAPSGIAVRLLGLPFLVWGGYAAQQIVSTKGWTADLCGLGFFGLVALTGLYMLARVDDLVVDLWSRTYLRRSGLWPLLWRQRGSLNEISTIQVRSETRQLPPREGIIDPTVLVVVVSLHWKDSAVRPFRLAQSDLFAEEKAHRNLRGDARSLGQLIGIPVLEPS